MPEKTTASEVSLGAETVKATAAKFSMAAIGFVGTIIFARMLGPQKFGAYYLLFALVKIADLPIEGWSMAAKKRFSEQGAQISEIVGGQFVFVFAWIALGTLVALLTGSYIVSYTGVAVAVPLFIALLGGEAVYVSAERLLQSRGLVGKATWIDALRSYVTFGLQLALVLAGWGVAGMAYGLAVASVVVAPLTLYFVGVRPEVPSRETLASQWEYARYSVLSALFGRVYERFDVLLLGYLLGPTAAGWYEVAYKLVTPAKFVAETASSGLMARVSNLSSRGKELNEDVTNVLSYASILSVPIFFGGLAISEPLVVTIYGLAYAKAAPLLIVIALYHVVMTQNMPLEQTIYGLDLPRRLSVISAGTVILNIVLGFALVPIVGAVGAALSSLVAETVSYLLLRYSLNQMANEIEFMSSTFLKQCLAGCMMVSLLYLVYGWNLQAGILSIAPALMVGAVIYFTILLTVSNEVRITVRSVITEIFIS
ncbi:oligosaccharide flippase family protein [Halospeciosus flavus]|uniref:Oligosaccharide flippase family protein n=2 Tax=Halospeciosus flavus TaxID=3032283 RepID=A0ABD5Z454_9EURY|nr:oligosaccharide flippase family protein [Halospeciosus flavus]